MDSVELQVPVLLPTDKESASQLLANVKHAIEEALLSPKSLGKRDGKSKFVCELKLDNPDRPFLVIKINLPACTYDHNILLENDVVDGAKLACYMAIHAILKVSKKRGIPLNPHEIFDTKSIALRMVTLTYFIENKDSNEALKILDAMNMRVSLLPGYRGVESRDADGILRKTTYRNNQKFGDMCSYIKGEKPAKKSHIYLDRFETKVQDLLKNAATRFIRMEFKFSAKNLSSYCWDSKKGIVLKNTNPTSAALSSIEGWKRVDYDRMVRQLISGFMEVRYPSNVGGRKGCVRKYLPITPGNKTGLCENALDKAIEKSGVSCKIERKKLKQAKKILLQYVEGKECQILENQDIVQNLIHILPEKEKYQLNFSLPFKIQTQNNGGKFCSKLPVNSFRINDCEKLKPLSEHIYSSSNVSKMLTKYRKKFPDVKFNDS